MIRALVAREWRRAIGGAAFLPVVFFLIVATLIPFAVGPDPTLLSRIGGGALWVAALTAALLPVERLVEPDRADGVLDQLSLRGVSEEAVAFAKALGHWLSFGPLLLLAAVPGAALLGLDGAALGRALVSLAVGTPGLAALAVGVAALTSGVRAGSALGGLLLLPLAIPLLIFAAAASGDAASGALKLEAAVSLFLCAAAPFVAGAAFRAGRS
ncbi:heme ABC transporter permease CcmB [Sphingomonas ginkgonis]|uniref:Heme exporter protein B n=1 Tax=Sphingomonas ginkgonis TaxID=2315330 RepID=A0A3R9YK51_9SPHN|nr:heme exporter protein CcmB [Sphingomonas ginkgonis]RST29577.1 heme ABC transporter permease CcmB [Sphingomonas ginkgonis]